METIFKDIRKWFNDYYNSCVSTDGKKYNLLILKLEHSIKVGNHAKAISEDEEWPAFEVDVAETLGLLHDVGRFSQLVEFGTFSDAYSINHGERGYSDVRSSGVLQQLPQEIQTILLNGIRFHNARRIPDDLDKASTRFLKLIRDADKLDIFRIIHKAVHQKSTERQPEIILHVDINGPVNPAALSELENRQNVSYRNIKSLADFGLMQLSWIYDLNYRYSFKYFSDHGIFANIIDILPSNPDVMNAIDAVANYLSSKQSA
ncbi:MAG: HD domain-containing protein [Candidatus Latescibacteria bacterium]|nr:HD domain-containing protein [Candidatus Latescibacterota bacterium]